jgi:hypothetical protein
MRGGADLQWSLSGRVVQSGIFAIAAASLTMITDRPLVTDIA